MNITFTPQPIPELTLAGGALGFTAGTPLQLTLQHYRLWVATVTDEATWEVLCEASQQRQDLGADGVRQSGELVTGSPSQVLLGLSNRRSLLRPVLFGCGGGKLGDLEFEINHLGHRSMVVR